MNQQLDLKINEIRSRLTDLSLLTLSIFFLPNVVIGIMRSLHYQYGVTDVITITVMVIYLLTFFFRKRIETKIKGIILIGGIFFIVNGAFYSYGLLSLGMSLSLISAVLASLLFERKEQMVVFGVIVSVVSLYGFLSVRGNVEVSLDVEKYMTSSFAWITQSVGIMTMVLMVFLAVTFVFRSLVSTSSQVIEAQLEMERLIEGLPDVMYSINENREFVLVNSSMLNVLGKRVDDLVGKHYTAAFESSIFDTDTKKDLWSEKLEQTYTLKKPLSFQFEYFIDQEKRISDVKLIPVIDEEGNVKSVIGNNRDISALVDAEKKIQLILETENERLDLLVKSKTDELEATMKELMHSERLASLGSLVAGVSHEINTPLGVAVSATSYLHENNDKVYNKLVEGALSADDLVAYLKKTDETSGIIATNLARAAELVKSFKEISVNQSSEMISLFNLCQYIDSVLLTLKHEYKNMNIAIAVECPGDMEIRSYPSAFSQVLTNLVMNAITHAFEGEERGNIRITANRTRRELVLKVVDDGVGIDADHLGRVFDPFFTTKRGAGGSGLGLNIVYNLVTDKLGGTITCTSTLGKGAVFTINIPDVVEVEEGV